MRGRSGVIAVAALLITTVVGNTGAASGAAATPTVVRHVSPVDADGVLLDRYEVAHRYGDARCQRGSAMTGTAYRCFTAQSPQGIHDPCWVTTSSDHVICLDVPWRKHKVVQLHVTDGYDDVDGFGRQRRPWGLRVDIDRRCLLHPAAVESTHGFPVHYYCNKHVALAGPIDRSGARWRIRGYVNTTPHGVQSTYQSLGWLHVVTAWRGKQSRVG
jgi:hypothetical protein